MIELIYALSACGAIQHDLKDAFMMFERMFGIQLGNFYRVYSDIKIKKEPTAFINKLKTSLLDKITVESQ